MSIAPRVFLLAGALFAAGCQPRDPLDWKVTAGTPAAYNAWSERTLPQFPPELKAEYVRAFHWLAVNSPGGITPRHMTDEHFPLCKKLHGLTVREVLVAGYVAERQRLLERVGTETGLMLHNLKAREKVADAAGEARFERVQEAQAKSIAAINRRLAEIDARMKALAAAAR